MAATDSDLRVRADATVSVLILLLAFVPALVTTPFLGGQAWYSFTLGNSSTSDLWGAACAVLCLAPFVGAPLGIGLMRRRGATWPAAVLVGAAAAFVAECIGLGLGMVTAALGGM